MLVANALRWFYRDAAHLLIVTKPAHWLLTGMFGRIVILRIATVHVMD
jgi:hypothetical protein